MVVVGGGEIAMERQGVARRGGWGAGRGTQRDMHILSSLILQLSMYVGGYQDYGPLLGPLNTRCRIIILRLKDPKRDHILTTTHVRIYVSICIVARYPSLRPPEALGGGPRPLRKQSIQCRSHGPVGMGPWYPEGPCTAI